MRTKIFLGLIWLIFFVRGIFYCVLFPIWEGYDEPYHFAYVEYVSAQGRAPIPTAPISRDVEASLHVLPLPWMLRLHELPPPVFTHDEYWKLSANAREQLELEFSTIPHKWSTEPAVQQITNYETQQPPLYYFLSSIPLRLAHELSLSSRVLLLRLLNIALASLVIPLGYFVAFRIFRDENVATAILIMPAAMPELMINVSRASNEGLALVIYTAMVYFMVKVVEGPNYYSQIPKVGALLGLGLLTKAYFLSAIPAFCLLLLWCFWHSSQRRRQLITNALIAAVLIVAFAGPWYWRNHALTGSWSGEMHAAQLSSTGIWNLLAQVTHVNWISGVVSVLLSHIWFGNWSFLRVANWIYLYFGIGTLLAVCGMAILVVRLWRNRQKSPPQFPLSGHIFTLVVIYTFFSLALAYHVLITYVAQGVSASAGWYLYAVVIPEVLLLWLGLSAILSRRMFSTIMSAVVVSLILLDLYTVHFLLMPYYTGMIAHDLNDKIVPASASALAGFSFANLMERLSANKPELVGSVAAFTYVGYLAAALATLGLTFWVVMRASGGTEERRSLLRSQDNPQERQGTVN